MLACSIGCRPRSRTRWVFDQVTAMHRSFLGDAPADLARFIADFRESSGLAYDEPALRLALLSGLVWLGWNKALDAAEHPDPKIRERERQDREWWVGQGRRTLESGLL